MADLFCQGGFEARFDWGVAGVSRLAPGPGDVVVVVDILSFSTAVDVAVSRGAVVYPFLWKDERATSFAAAHHARLAVGRRQVTSQDPLSLSPASLLGLTAGERVVLPSPNGATVTLAAAQRGATVLVGCLRNAAAVARTARALGGTVFVIAAGELWSDGSLRFAVEDLLGAGALLARLGVRPSPEAQAAMKAFDATDPRASLLECSSGRELLSAGFPEDIRLAAEVDVSESVPVLRGGTLVSLDQVSDEKDRENNLSARERT